jgi:hypothetical protein
MNALTNTDSIVIEVVVGFTVRFKIVILSQPIAFTKLMVSITLVL